MYQQAKARHPSYIESGVDRVWRAGVEDGTALSPVDLAVEAATPLHLAPLCWTGYDQTPSAMTVTNSGFTVMVNACFGGGGGAGAGEAPHLSRGPLRADYVFSQIHFHWGEHDRTGSGHAVKGIRYPLEMHVVHLKKDCANLKEALQSKDGITVLVYLFALREERNAQLDQLTAILQFIRRARARARLHPTALAELAPPFTADYFLYWGAVGSPSGRYRILWMVSRRVLPVSGQQLREFRQLYDSQGNLLVSNSSKPHPLGDRTLFLVSPSEETRETVYGIVCGMTGRQEDMAYVDTSMDIRDAEYKSLRNLEEVANENCRICPAQKRTQNVTRVNVDYPYRVNEGDTSIEESCVDLSNGTDEDQGVTVKTETKTEPGGRRVTNVTNVNVTTCRHHRAYTNRARRAPSEEVYAVVSARGSELHLRRRPVRQHERSVEQACMLLSATRSNSAPSLAATQEHTDLADRHQAITKLSSEVAVHNRYSESEIERSPPRHRSAAEYDEFEHDMYEENVRSSKRARRVTVVGQGYQSQNDENPTNDRPVEIDGIGKSQMSIPHNKRFLHKQLDESDFNGYYKEDRRESEDNKRSQYFLVKQVQNKKPFYKVIGELPKSCNKSKTTAKKFPETTENYTAGRKDKTKKTEENVTVSSNRGQTVYSEFQQDISCDDKENRTVIRKHVIPNIPPTKMLESRKCGEETNNTTDYSESRKHQDRDPVINITTESDPHYKVSLLVRTTVSDHRKPGKKPIGSAQKYYVTKISPKDEPIFVTPKSSNSKVEKCDGKVNKEKYYYANPIVERETTEVDVPNESSDYITNEAYMSEYEEAIEESHKQFRKEQYLKTTDQETIHTENERKPTQTLKSDLNGRKPLQTQSVFNTNTYDRGGIADDKIVESHHEESADKHISQRYSSSEVNDVRKHSNLVERTNVYHGKNSPDEDVRVIDRIITGTVGKSDSTEVFVQGKHVEVVKPRKIDVSKEVNYNLVTSKHPEPQYYVKEPPNNSGPREIVRQHLSLDQQVQGQSQVRQTVEYRRDRERQKASGHPVDGREISKSDRSDRNMTVATYEQSNHEQNSTTRKTQQIYKSMKQGETIDPTYVQNDYSEQDNVTMHNGKDKFIRQSVEDPKSTLPKTHTTDATDVTSSLYNVSRISSDMSQVTKVDIPKITDTYEDYKNMEHRVRDSRNAGMSSYEYEEESSSLSKKFESSKVRRKVQYVGEPLPNIADRIKGKPVEQNQHNSHDILPLKQPDFVISDKRPRVSFQNDDNQNIYEDIEYEERTEEDSLYTSQRMEGKKITSHVKSKTPYKMPARTHPQLIAPSDDTLSINKVEIPEPHYITRVPKQPLVEFEAYPVDPHEPFQIVSESQEMSSKGENQKTFMMFKRINGKAVLNQPSVIEPITIKSNRNEQSTNDQSVTEQARRSNQYSQDQFRNNQIRNEKSINEQDSLDRASNEQYRHDRSSYNKSRRDELTRSEDHYRHNKPINELSKNEQPRSDQYVQGQLENDQSRFEERLRLSDSNTKSVIPINRSKTVPTLSENAGNQVLIEEFNEENMAHDKQSRSVTRKQMRGSFPLEVNNKTPKTEIEKTHVEIDVQSNTPTTGKIEPQAVILRKPNIPLALPRDAERRRVLAEYEYSETSLLSQKKIIRKQKRYMYNVQQPPLFEEPTPSISKNNRQAIHDGFSNTTNERIRDREPQQEEESLVVPTQDESSEDRRLIQDTPSWNANEESDRGYKNTNQYIDQEYYESAINKNKTYKASKRQFEANQREMNPVPTLSGPSSFDHRPQDHRIVQDTSSRNRKNETTETDTDLNKPVPYQVVAANTSLDSPLVQDIIPTPNMNIKSDNAYQSPDIYINEEYYENSINKNRTYKSSRRQFETNQTADYNMAFVQTQPGPSHLMPFQPQDDSVPDTSSRDRNLENDYAYGNANRLIDQHHHEISSDKNKYNSYGQSGSQSTETDRDSNKDLSQGLAHPSQYRRVSQDVPSQNRNIESDSAYQNTNLYINQEYIESSTNKNKSYKSSTRQFTSNERAELDPRRSQLGPSQSIPPPSLGQNGHIFSNAEDLHDEDEPTKDNLTTSGRTMPLSNTTTARGGRVSNRKSQYGDQGRGQSLGTTAPSTKTDGDIVIYIRQPRVRKEHVVPKITVDVTDKHKVSPSQINQQTVKIQEIKPKRTNKGKRRITVRKSKSENIYRQSNSSDSSSDENMETSLQTESNEEQVLDTTHYNLTLKSQTTVDISKSDKANVKSTAEVRITPLNSTPKIELEESCSDAKMIMTEARETTSYETSSADACDGRQAYQSPIKIDSATAQTRQYPRLCFHNHWNANGEALLENNGKTLRASLADNNLDDDEDAWPCVEGGPLVGRYNFVELHFHWGWKDCCGAEHVIDGERHALEAHFLYVKKEYKSLETGMRHADGLATVAVKFDVGGPPHSGLGRLLADVRLIREADTGVYVAARALFTWLRPTVDSGCGYFCYKGTLTKNPPCVDCVTWLVFPQPIVFCCQQSSEFRKLKSSTGEELRKNFRTPQPLNNRPVYYVPLPLPLPLS